MISGRPPFNGENHIDLLRNIQRKAVRLPPDVRVSKACVNLLRLLLNRNPLSRAGFKEFFDASDAFVALGCGGVGASDAGSCRIPNVELASIPENDNGASSPTPGSDSLLTVATASQPQQGPGYLHSSSLSRHAKPNRLGPIPNSATETSPNVTPTPDMGGVKALSRQYPSRLAPLTQSPPTAAQTPSPNTKVPLMQPLGEPRQAWQPNNYMDLVPSTRPDMSYSQASTDDSGFVMVEYGTNSRTEAYDQAISHTIGQPSNSTHNYYLNPPSTMAFKTDNGRFRRTSSKGMLSTSPGTGGLLMGLVGRARLGQLQVNANPSFGEELAVANKMLATAEDVGRRGVSVAHLGDTRAYIGMRLIHLVECSSSFLSTTPMDGVEEEPNENSENCAESDDSSSTEIMAPARRRSSVSMDKDMKDVKADDQVDEMPFAISPDTPALALPSREASISAYHKGSSMSSMKRPMQKVDPMSIRVHFGEALSCYLKALTMLKGAVAAVQKVGKDLESLMTQVGRSPSEYNIPLMQRRCEVTTAWLTQQFQGVLERADAAVVEIAKLPQPPEGTESPPTATVEELIYNHALASGRDGAVKQLLGQYEAARSCYRSAGLLAETILMEANIGADDRKVLEGYVDGFAARITELDLLMIQQSRVVGGSNGGRGSGVIGLIGPPSAAPTSFLIGSSH